MFNRLNTSHKGMVFALAGYSGFAISDASAKFLTASLPIIHIVAFIVLCACMFLALAAPFIGGFRKPKPGLLKFHILRGVMNFMVSVLIVTAFSKLPLASAYTIVFAKPFLVALLAIPLYGQKVQPRHWAVIAAGFTGVVIAMRPSLAGIDPAMLLALGAACCSALMWVTARSLQEETPFALGFYPALCTAVLCLPFVLGDFRFPALGQLPFIMICGAGISCGIVCLSLAYRAAPSSAAIAPFHYSQMIWGGLLGYLIFGDVPSSHTLIGAFIIIASGLYLILSERKNL